MSREKNKVKSKNKGVKHIAGNAKSRKSVSKTPRAPKRPDWLGSGFLFL